MCTVGYLFPVVKPHSLQMLHGNHSQFRKGQAVYQGHKIGEKSGRLGSHTKSL